MKRFEFRLEQVLRLKQQRLRLAELHQQQAQANRDRAWSEVTALRDRLTRAAAALAAEGSRGGSMALWVAQSRHAARLEQDLREAEANAARADKALREAVARRLAADREVEALAALRESEWADYRREATRREQDWHDERGLRGWKNRSTAGNPEIEEGKG